MPRFNQNDRHKYDDIIDFPRHVSRTRPHMPSADRAAQFMPFAALTGHGAAVEETARLTSERIEPDESFKALLDQKLRIIREHLSEHPEVSITYFIPDLKKEGGSYAVAEGRVIRINEYDKTIALSDGTKLPIDEIIEIESHDIIKDI